MITLSFLFVRRGGKAAPHAPLGIDPSPGGSSAILRFFSAPEATLPSILCYQTNEAENKIQFLFDVHNS